MDPTTADLLARITASLDDLDDAALVGVYPFGSIAWGDYVLGTSDVDVMAVIDGSIAAPTAAAERWTALARASEPVAGLEVVVVTAEHAARPTDPPFVEMELGTFRDNGWAIEITGRGPSEDHGPNLAKAIILETRSHHAGPPPGEVFAPIPQKWLRDAAVSELEYWANLPRITGEPNRVRTAILNACRARHLARVGALCSKRQGGEWALRQPDTIHPDVIHAALGLQAGATTEHPDDRAIRDIVTQALWTLTGPG